METLTTKQAFRAMVIFLEQFYDRTQANDVGGLLGDLMIVEDETTTDPVAWEDWLESVRKSSNQK